MLLHIVNKSPFERNALESCLRLSNSGHSILLYEDGVYGALQNTKWAATVADATITVNFHESADVRRHFTTEITFDH